jgi:hypothetical protein
VIDCLQRKWPGWAGAIAVALAAVGLPACRVGPVRADALTEPFPDGAIDLRGAGGSSGDSGPPCDLLQQICPEPTQFCYPVDGVAGATTCKPAGSGSVMTACVSNLECDGREACVLVPESGLQMCVTICDTSALDTGCPPKAPCHLIPGYHAGYCVP